MTAYDVLLSRLRDIEDLRAVGEQLYWDQATHLPPGAVAARSRQSALIEQEVRRRAAGAELGKAIEQAEREQPPDADAALVVKVARRDYETALAQPVDLLAEFAATGTTAQAVWRHARTDNDWATFAPWLDKLVTLNRAIAEHVGYADHPQDALMSMYEPGPTRAEVDTLIAPLVEPLRALARERNGLPARERRFPSEAGVRPEQLLSFTRRLGEVLGFDAARGTVDASSHPATSGACAEDVRITVRTDVPLTDVITSAAHEFGHALYDQGIAAPFWGTPIGRGSMPYLHESQSKFLENHLALEPAFASLAARLADEEFGAGAVPAAQLATRLVSRTPNLVRIESDEVGFVLHIVLRWQLECLLLDGTLSAADLPAAWNERIEHLLGLTPTTDTRGCLQDPHWCHRYFGLFPGYLVGNVLAAQLWDACIADGVDANAALRAADLTPVVSWLRSTVHSRGRAETVKEVAARLPGGGLDPRPYRDHLLRRYAVCALPMFPEPVLPAAADRRLTEAAS